MIREKYVDTTTPRRERPVMKKRIPIDVEVEITGSMLVEGLKSSDPLTKLSAVSHIMNAMPGTELKAVMETLPFATMLFLQDMKDFVARTDRIREEVEGEVDKELDESLKEGADGRLRIKHGPDPTRA